MKQNRWTAFLHLLGLPEGLPFVLFCSLLGSLVTEAVVLSDIALAFAANLAIYCFAQVYKHISNAPEDAFSPAKADPNPIAYGLVSLHSARIALYFALITSLVAAFLLSRINIVLTLSSIFITLALFHTNIRISNRLMLGFNHRHFLYGGIFLLNSIFANQKHPAAIEILFPLIFISGLYLLFKSEEVRTELPQNQATMFWRIFFTAIVLISAAGTFLLLKPVPFWIIALWVFITAVQLSINFSSQSDFHPHQHLYQFRVFEVSGVVSFLVYLIFFFIKNI